jgi:hypothetical protein
MRFNKSDPAKLFRNKTDHLKLVQLVEKYGASGIAFELFDIAKFRAYLLGKNGELARAGVELGTSTVWEEAHTKLVELEKNPPRPKVTGADPNYLRVLAKRQYDDPCTAQSSVADALYEAAIEIERLRSAEEG